MPPTPRLLPRLPLTVALVPALAAAALPAAASAQATVVPGAPCAVAGTTVAATLGGLPPGQVVRVGFRNDVLQPKVTVGPDGTAAVPAVPTPRFLAEPDAHATEAATLAAWPDVDDPALAPLATAAMRIGQSNAFLLPKTADVSRVRTIDAAGFATGVPLYAHVRIGSRTRRTVSLGRTGACGDVRVARRLLTKVGRLPDFGVAYVLIDASKRYAKRTVPQAELQVQLRRRFVGVRPNVLTSVLYRTFRAAPQP